MTVSCPKCRSKNSRVLDSRHRGDGTRRRRECDSGHRFTTFEVVVPSNTHKYTIQVIVHRTLTKQEVYSSVTIGGDDRPKSRKKIKTVDDLNDRQKASLANLKQKILKKKEKKNDNLSKST